MKEYPLNIVVGTPIKDGKCLLIRRTKEPHKGYWSLPGGKLEYGEDIKNAIARELKEETGLAVEFTGLRGIVSEVLRDHDTNEVKGHFLIWVCGLNHVDGEPTEKNEGKVQWFSREELDKEKATVIPRDYLMTKRFIFGNAPTTNFYTVHMWLTQSGYEIERTDL